MARPGEVAVIGVTDGDTLTVADGRRVRLAQVDAPETNQCFGSQATAALRVLTAGTSVVLRRPPGGPEKDKYGRTLADVLVNGMSVNEALVREGAAEWYEQFADEDADLARRLKAAEQEARDAGRGLWAACATQATTPPAPPVATTVSPKSSGGGDCDASYPDVCIPSGPPDLDCGDIPYRRFRVLPPDPHRFDANNDGVGCQSP
jgi:micrococcal nuclease